MNTNDDNGVVWKFSPQSIFALAMAAILISVAYSVAISELLRIWGVREEYSYGYMIPFITAFLIWQRKDLLERMNFSGAWFGVVLALIGFSIYFLGELSALYLLVQYSMIIMVLGLALAMTGWPAFRIIFVPLLFLLFMIPLPQFFLGEISQQLQFLSSEIGVAFIRAFGISVYLEGNVIDLGVYKLQVVEACSGLRYLFPLMALGFMAAYFFNGAMWKRVVIFISTIPITIFMNSFRIGAIGVMVEHWGIDMAEGFLHDFEGWIIFMACMAVLMAEMWFLARIGPDKKPLHVAFGIIMPEPAPKKFNVVSRKIPLPYYFALSILSAVVLASYVLPDREEFIPKRKTFASFPLNIENWHGRTDTLETIILDELKLNDYMLANYRDNETTVNLYIAFYDSQRKGQSAHSPRTCVPGGGWKITDISPVDVKTPSNFSLKVNRVEIQKGEIKQLMYYWFQGRGRNITNEYLVKWFIFWDSLRIQRSDGALVRIGVLIPPGGDVEFAENKLKDFTEKMLPVLGDYVPN